MDSKESICVAITATLRRCWMRAGTADRRKRQGAEGLVWEGRGDRLTATAATAVLENRLLRIYGGCGDAGDVSNAGSQAMPAK